MKGGIRNLWRGPGSVAVLGTLMAMGSAAAGVKVWELPAGGGGPAELVKREGWRAAAAESRFSGGAALENERLLLLALPGATGLVLSCKSAGLSTQCELRIVGTGPGKIDRVMLLEADSTEATLRVQWGSSEADILLGAGRLFVEIKPGKGARRLECATPFRYALVPILAGDDKLYDARQVQSAAVTVSGQDGLLQFQKGGDAIVALMWKGVAGGDPEGPKKAEEKPEAQTAELRLAAGEAERLFASAVAEFLGRPVYVGILQGSGIWHSLEVRNLPGGKTLPLAWKRPFEAAWKVDLHVTDYDKGEIAGFLKKAADLGLSKDHENDWRNSYLTMDEKRKDSDPLRMETSFFMPAGNDGQLPPMTTPPREGDDRVWPFVFRGAETLVTVPAEWPCYPDPTKERLASANKRLAEEGQEPFWPLHMYGSFLIYPLDRTDKTAVDRFTVVDLLRQALGIGPCKLDWLERCR